MEQRPENYDLGKRFIELNSRRGRLARLIVKNLENIGELRVATSPALIKKDIELQARFLDKEL